MGIEVVLLQSSCWCLQLSGFRFLIDVFRSRSGISGSHMNHREDLAGLCGTEKNW